MFPGVFISSRQPFAQVLAQVLRLALRRQSKRQRGAGESHVQRDIGFPSFIGVDCVAADADTAGGLDLGEAEALTPRDE